MILGGLQGLLKRNPVVGVALVWDWTFYCRFYSGVFPWFCRIFCGSFCIVALSILIARVIPYSCVLFISRKRWGLLNSFWRVCGFLIFVCEAAAQTEHAFANGGLITAVYCGKNISFVRFSCDLLGGIRFSFQCALLVQFLDNVHLPAQFFVYSCIPKYLIEFFRPRNPKKPDFSVVHLY